MEHTIFALGMPVGADWLYILIAVVVLFGADKIPKLAKGLGRSLGEFKKAKEDFEKEVHAAGEPEPKKLDNAPNLATGTPVNTATSVAELTKKS